MLGLNPDGLLNDFHRITITCDTVSQTILILYAFIVSSHYWEMKVIGSTLLLSFSTLMSILFVLGVETWILIIIFSYKIGYSLSRWYQKKCKLITSLSSSIHNHLHLFLKSSISLRLISGTLLPLVLIFLSRPSLTQSLPITPSFYSRMVSPQSSFLSLQIF